MKKFIIISLFYMLALSLCSLTQAALIKIVCFKKDNASVIVLYDVHFGILYGQTAFKVDLLQNEALESFFNHLGASQHPLYLYLECDAISKEFYQNKPQLSKNDPIIKQLYSTCAHGKHYGSLYIDSWDERTMYDLEIFEIIRKFADKVIEIITQNFPFPKNFGGTAKSFLNTFDTLYGQRFFLGNKQTDPLRSLYESYKTLSLGTAISILKPVKLISTADFLKSTFTWLTAAYELKEKSIFPADRYDEFSKTIIKLLSTLYLLKTDENVSLNHMLIKFLEQKKSLAQFYEKVGSLFTTLTELEGDISLYKKLINIPITSDRRLDIFHIGLGHHKAIEDYYKNQGYEIIDTFEVVRLSLEQPLLFKNFLIEFANRCTAHLSTYNS